MIIVLFVDDEPNILNGLQRMLRPMRREWELCFAHSGAEALAILAEKKVDVIVSDMKMPGMDGVQFLAQVKAIAPYSVRVMLTGNADQQTAISAVNEGSIFRFLNKPCPPETLAQTLTAGVELIWSNKTGHKTHCRMKL